MYVRVTQELKTSVTCPPVSSTQNNKQRNEQVFAGNNPQGRRKEDVMSMFSSELKKTSS